jgi:hypothetical protein
VAVLPTAADGRSAVGNLSPERGRGKVVSQSHCGNWAKVGRVQSPNPAWSTIDVHFRMFCHFAAQTFVAVCRVRKHLLMRQSHVNEQQLLGKQEPHHAFCLPYFSGPRRKVRNACRKSHQRSSGGSMAENCPNSARASAAFGLPARTSGQPNGTRSAAIPGNRKMVNRRCRRKPPHILPVEPP